MIEFVGTDQFILIRGLLCFICFSLAVWLNCCPYLLIHHFS